MDTLDRQILNEIQRSFPLTERPFHQLGNHFNLEETQIIERLKKLKNEEKIIRNISGIFNVEKLGYKSVLVAFSIQEENLNKGAENINSLSNVSHNYHRDHQYNLWFTLSISRNDNVNDFIDKLARDNKISKYLILPAKKVYKSEVIFNLSEDPKQIIKDSLCKKEIKQSLELNAIEKNVINQLQKDLSLTEKPFQILSESIELKESQFLDIARQLLENQVMKRYSATIRHHKAGFIHNAMIVWQLEEENISSIAKQILNLPCISHCYERITCSDWPYNFYTMMHARSIEEFDQQVSQLKNIMGNVDYMVLKTLKEFKKERVKYLI